MSALNDPDVGTYLNRHYVAAVQKVASFKVVHGVKVGGNVAAYFCTPDGRVLHAVAGPVNATVLLREARWANVTYQLAQLEPAEEMPSFFRNAHLDRLKRERPVSLQVERLPAPEVVTAKVLDDLMLENRHLRLGTQGKVHLLLTVGAMPRLEQLYRVLFERVLNEKISTDPVEVVER